MSWRSVPSALQTGFLLVPKDREICLIPCFTLALLLSLQQILEQQWFVDFSNVKLQGKYFETDMIFFWDFFGPLI